MCYFGQTEKTVNRIHFLFSFRWRTQVMKSCCKVFDMPDFSSKNWAKVDRWFEHLETHLHGHNYLLSRWEALNIKCLQWKIDGLTLRSRLFGGVGQGLFLGILGYYLTLNYVHLFLWQSVRRVNNRKRNSATLLKYWVYFTCIFLSPHNYYYVLSSHSIHT